MPLTSALDDFSYSKVYFDCILGITALSESCKMLQTVYLRRCLMVNDDAVVAIATNCPYLTNLNLGGCHQLTDRSLFALAKQSRNLSSLNASHTQVAGLG